MNHIHNNTYAPAWGKAAIKFHSGAGMSGTAKARPAGTKPERSAWLKANLITTNPKKG